MKVSPVMTKASEEPSAQPPASVDQMMTTMMMTDGGADITSQEMDKGTILILQKFLSNWPKFRSYEN